MNALLLIDIQNDYFPGGKCELCGTDEAAHRAGEALEYFRNKHLPVFHIRHISTNGVTRFFLPGTEGSEIHASVFPREGEQVFIKHAPNSFLQTGLEEELRRAGADQLTVCGMMSHMCIDTGVRAAKSLGFSVTVLEDACAAKDLVWEGAVLPARTVHSVIMASLSGTFAKVMKTQDFISAGV